VAKFLHWLATPNTTLLLYQGLGPAMLGHQRRPTIGGVPQPYFFLKKKRAQGSLSLWKKETN